MNNPFRLNVPNDEPLFEFASMNVPGVNREEYDVFTEAVFTNGSKSIEPIVDAFKVVKDTLMRMIGESPDNKKDTKDSKSKAKKFDPKEYWKDKCFKDLEDTIQKVFGFRAVRIQPYNEGYNSKTGEFDSKELNAYTYPSDRYPIDGLVTDKGFYDKTHSIFMDVYISLGLIKELEPDEITAVLLHELGHNIDPVLVDIKYMEVNILSKYLTDRKEKIDKNESRFIKEHKLGEEMIIVAALIVILLIATLPSIFSWIYEKIVGKEKVEQKKLDKIRDIIKKEKEEFNRKNASEAFADNFARMYGYGSTLMKALRKISKDMDKQLKSLVKSERTRRDIIVKITELTIKDEHKTDMHRINALIKEYNEDLKDPNIPKKVKESIKKDLDELQSVIDAYTNDFDNFQNRVNKTIIEELQKKDITNGSEEEIKESYDYFDEASRGKLKYAFRSALDYDTGHLVRVIYDMAGLNITAVGELEGFNELSRKEQELLIASAKKNISTKGNMDFRSNNQKVLAIVDRVTGENIKNRKVTTIGPYQAFFNYGTRSYLQLELDKEDLELIHKSIPRGSKEYKDQTIDIKVGDIEPGETYKSTKWFKSDKMKLRSVDGEIITVDAQLLKVLSKDNPRESRGAKADDIDHTFSFSRTTRYNHPSKKDVKNNPRLYDDGYKKQSIYDIVESVSDESEIITESKKAYEELMKRRETVTSSERAEFYKLFGHSKECSLGKDKDGYYVYTHRARSDSYKKIADIPEKSVKFIRSTS